MRGVFDKRRGAISTFDLGHRVFVVDNEALGIKGLVTHFHEWKTQQKKMAPTDVCAIRTKGRAECSMHGI